MRHCMSLKCILVLLLATAAMNVAHGYTVYCVGNSSQLNTALQHAQSAADTTVIELVQGSYNLGGTLLTTASPSDAGVQLHATKLQGGYDGTCSTRVINPENTVFDGAGLFGNMNMQGSLTIEGVRFQNFNRSVEFQVLMSHIDNTSTSVLNTHFVGTGLHINYFCSDYGSILASGNLVSRSPVNGLWLSSACRSLITGTLHTTEHTLMNVTGNTVADSSGHGVLMQWGEPTPPGGTAAVNALFLYNNIVWGNWTDVYLQTGDLDHNNDPGGAQLSDNVYGSIYGYESPADSASTNSLHLDPQFVNRYGTPDGDYHLRYGSPAINSGDASATGLAATDLDDKSRIIGSAPDRGAYESYVNDVASTTLTVTNANDSGAGSLRQAIVDANASGGTHFIEFNINASCPQVINLASDLPYVSLPYLSINGFTQPGSKRNTYTNGDIAKRCIVLNGQGRSQSMGLTFYGASSAFYWIQGLAFEGWGIGLNMSAGQNNLVWGNQFGGSLYYGAGNLALAPNGVDIWLWGNSTTTTIGGSDPADRNIIDSAGANSHPNSPNPNYDGRGVAISSGGGSQNNSVINNIIGLDNFESSTPYGNAVGIQLETSGNTISGNVIGNNNNGIQVLGSGAHGNAIANNLIGVSQDPLCIFAPCPPPNPEPNQAAIYFWQGANNNSVSGNTVINNTLFGIEMIDSGTYANAIWGNSIYGNPATWATNKAEINLDGYAYSTTYSLAFTVPPNRYLNYPIISSVSGTSSNGTISGYLRATNDTYTIQVYSSPSCEAGGAFAHSPSAQTTISNAGTYQNLHYDGTANFSFNFTAPPGLSLAGRYITATATDSHNNTSQFSACALYQLVQ